MDDQDVQQCPAVAGFCLKGRKLFFKGTKALKKVVDYATMEDKATLAELQSRISELEDRLDP